MLLRSSSTPVLGSLLSSLSSDSPNNGGGGGHHQRLYKSPFHQHHQIGCLSLTPINSCNSSPSINELSEYFGRTGLRRVQSEGNLDGLGLNSNRQKSSILESIPSFSLCNSGRENDEGEPEEEAGGGGGDCGLRNKMKNMVLSEQNGVFERNWNVDFEDKRRFISEEMYLAKGLGIGGGSGGGGGGSGGGGGGRFREGGGDGGDIDDTDEYYKKMLHDNPGNPLFSRNYAKFLYQTKRDLEGAEEYYSRAILADPKDGEVLAEYARLAWELHKDLDKASSYFERAVQASPESSHVHAAYASFLWETEAGEDECSVIRDSDSMPPLFQGGITASTGA